MNSNRMGKIRRYMVLFFTAALICLVLAQVASAAPLVVRVQPSGDDFARAYVITGEARTYFGNVEGGTAPYEFKWDFDDSAPGSYAAVGNPHYIAVDGKVFSTAGTHWARLTVRDNIGTESSASINLQVIASASDNLRRQKNSAIDRGLRYIYQQEIISGATGYWPGSGGYIAATSMALIAMENHGHNLQSPDSDIYKKSVQRGGQYLLDNAQIIAVATQQCIGDPEDAPGDTLKDGVGVKVTDDSMYTNGLAGLALANSCDKATAQSTFASTASGVNGMSLYDIAIQMRDFLAWAQGDMGGAANYVYFTPVNYSLSMYAQINNLQLSQLQGYIYIPDLTVLGCNGNFVVDWGDGTTDTYASGVWYCPYYSNDGYPTIGGYDTPTKSHLYAAGGNYTINVTYDDGVHAPVPVATAQVTATGGGGVCNDGGANGGWRYTANFGDSDNSVTQWPVLALSEMKTRWGIDVNPNVVSRLTDWLGYSQCSNGAFGYTMGDASGWCNYGKGAAGAIMLRYVGKSQSDAPVQNVMNYLSSSWNSTGCDGNFDEYSMYALFKAMKVWGKTDLGGVNWTDAYTQFLVNRQNGDGSWPGSCWMDQPFDTYVDIAILAPEVASLPPVAEAGGPYPDVTAGQVFTLNGGGSYHLDPAKSIVKWCWDFDASNGLWWDTNPTPAAGEGACGVTVNASYPDAGQDKTYTVTLQVTDNSTPTPIAATDTATVKVTSGNVPPVAVTNGPWTTLPNQPIVFDGTGSYDPNAGAPLNDEIVKYEWDLNGDGVYNGADDGTPVTPNRSIVTKSYPNPQSLPVKLRVTDKFGLTGTSSDSLNIVAVTIVYGTQYQICWRQVLDRFTEKLGITVDFANQGNAAADNLVMTLTNTPSNLLVMSATSSLGTLAAGQHKWSACNPQSKTADIILKFDKRTSPTGVWKWAADFDVAGTHYRVTDIPALP